MVKGMPAVASRPICPYSGMAPEIRAFGAGCQSEPINRGPTNRREIAFLPAFFSKGVRCQRLEAN